MSKPTRKGTGIVPAKLKIVRTKVGGTDADGGEPDAAEVARPFIKYVQVSNSKPRRYQAVATARTVVEGESIWSKSFLKPDAVRLPGKVLEDAERELNGSGSPYKAKVTGRRRKMVAGEAKTLQTLSLIAPDNGKVPIATVEFPEAGYPATLMLGKAGHIYLSVASEEELVEQIGEYTKSLVPMVKAATAKTGVTKSKTAKSASSRKP